MAAHTLVFLLAAAFAAFASAASARPEVPVRARMIAAGQSLDSTSRDSLEAAIAKALGNEIRIDNPIEDQVGDGADGDSFGASVSISGDTALVGVPDDDIGALVNQGSAYVFVRNGTVWTQQQKLIAADGRPEDNFGSSVAVSGDTAFVGAFGDDVGTNDNQGSVHVFVRSGSSWIPQQQITAADGAAGDFFGHAMAMSGTTVAIGAFGDDVAGVPDGGSAHVLVRNGSIWVQQQLIVADDGAMGDGFAFSLAMSGDTLVVGAPSDDSGSNVDQGSGYVFVRSGSSWIPQQKLVASSGQAGDQFGVSSSVFANTAILGAPFVDVDARVDGGAAYVFLRDSSAWTEQQRLISDDGASGDRFGAAVAVEGNTALIGAIGDDIGTGGDEGSVYVFVANSPSWGQQQKIASPVNLSFNRFGFSVALSGETALLGAKNNNGVHAPSGAAHTFLRSAGVWSEQQQLNSGFGATGEGFGFSVALSGKTAIVGNPGNSAESFTFRGSAYVFVRVGNVWVLQQRLEAGDGQSGDIFGISVAISSDTIVVGARADSVDALDEGSAYVFVRSGGTWTEQQRLTASDPSSQDNFGWSVGVSGDTAVVGAYRHNVGPNQDQGSAYVFVRSGSSWSEEQELIAGDGAAGDRFGYSVAIDANTIIAGADFDSVGTGVGHGSAYVFVRTGASWSEQHKLVALDAAALDLFGSSVALFGDTAIVGAPRDDVGANSDQGSAYVFVRVGTNWAQQEQLIVQVGQPGDALGRGLALSKDLAVIGAASNDAEQGSDQGSVHVFRRSGADWNEVQTLVASDGTSGDMFGWTVATSEGVTLIGAPMAQQSGPYANPDTGAIYIFDDPLVDVVFADGFEGVVVPP